MILELAGILLSLFMFLAAGWRGVGAGSMYEVSYLIDLPTLFCIMVIALPVFFKDGLKHGLAQDFLRAFRLLRRDYSCSFAGLRHTLDAVELMQRQILYAGCITTLEGCFMLIHTLSDAASVGPMVNVALIGVFYTAILELLLLPLQMEAKRRIIDYMEEDSESAAEGQMQARQDADTDSKEG